MHRLQAVDHDPVQQVDEGDAGDHLEWAVVFGQGEEHPFWDTQFDVVFDLHGGEGAVC